MFIYLGNVLLFSLKSLNIYIHLGLRIIMKYYFERLTLSFEKIF